MAEQERDTLYISGNRSGSCRYEAIFALTETGETAIPLISPLVSHVGENVKVKTVKRVSERFGRYHGWMNLTAEIEPG